MIEKILADIKKVPKIKGGFVFCEDEVKATCMLKESSVVALYRIGVKAREVVEFNKNVGFNISRVVMHYKKLNIIIKPLLKGYLLIILCEKGVSLTILNVTTNIIVNRLNGLLCGDPPSRSATIEPERGPNEKGLLFSDNGNVAQSPVVGNGRDSVIDNLTLSKDSMDLAVRRLKILLEESIGPIADFFFGVRLTRLLQEGELTMERFEEMVSAVSQDIIDPAEKENFINAAYKIVE